MNMQTADLFDVLLRPVDPSAAAAAEIAPKMPELRARVLDALRWLGPTGATDEELQTMLDMPPNTERPRRRELVQAKLVEDSGLRRPLKSGKSGTVWVVKE
jgi:hypothetical protein